jgi:nucleotide-binding universal stress UspA family protein
VEIDRTPFTDILVPLDGSTAAERALTPALELATRTGVPLRVLRRALTDEAEIAAEYLAGVTDRYAGRIDIDTEVVERGSIPYAIFQAVGPGTLVCMSSHGRGRVAQPVLGSVAETLLGRIDRPALVVGPHFRPDVRIAGRIVACIDGSPESEQTLAPARQWSKAFGLPLWLIEVAEPSPPLEWTTYGASMEAAPLVRLARRVGGVDAWDVHHGKHPARELAELAASPYQPTALLVMATHGRTGWDRLRLGSVTAATVHEATVPVLVVPAAPAAPVGVWPDAEVQRT